MKLDSLVNHIFLWNSVGSFPDKDDRVFVKLTGRWSSDISEFITGKFVIFEGETAGFLEVEINDIHQYNSAHFYIPWNTGVEKWMSLTNLKKVIE
jgi:hypothetical protein